ncbi:MAG TPA: hypothetical protein VG125_21255 [Pirellulales bacterium]|jgi:hypothetical protein|nr:hypothetical protein [Pirellulales bacterium]
MSSNPCQAPGATDDGVRFIEVETAADRIGERTLEAMAATQTWVRLVGWGAFVMAGWNGLRIVFFFRLGQSDRGGVLWLTATTLLNGALYATSGVLLLRYASRINDFMISRRVEHLDGALEAQRSFWRFLGVVLAVLVICVCGGILFAFLGISAMGVWKTIFG